MSLFHVNTPHLLETQVQCAIFILWVWGLPATGLVTAGMRSVIISRDYLSPSHTRLLRLNFDHLNVSIASNYSWKKLSRDFITLSNLSKDLWPSLVLSLWLLTWDTKQKLNLVILTYSVPLYIHLLTSLTNYLKFITKRPHLKPYFAK